jgi:hypothetical protein
LPTVASWTLFSQGAAFVPGTNALDALFSQGLALKPQ